MSKVYLELSFAPDRLLGHVKGNGNVYRSDAAPDDKIGHVDLESGKVYSRRLGLDKLVGHANLGNGKVYASRVGLDKNIGRVQDSLPAQPRRLCARRRAARPFPAGVRRNNRRELGLLRSTGRFRLATVDGR